MAAPTFVAVTDIHPDAPGTNATVTGITFATGSGNADDILVVSITTRDAAGGVSVPSGWTVLINDVATTPDIRWFLAYIRQRDLVNATFSISGSQQMAGSCVRYRPAPGRELSVALGAVSGSDSGTSWGFGDFNPTSGDWLCIPTMWLRPGGASGNTAPPSGFTERVDTQSDWVTVELSDKAVTGNQVGLSSTHPGGASRNVLLALVDVPLPLPPVPFAKALFTDHKVVSRADLLRGGVVVRTGIPVVAGTVEVDGSAAVRRRVSLSLVDEDYLLVPVNAGALLSPYGDELALYRGNEGTLYPLGVFGIDETSVVYSPGAPGVVQLEGYDRSARVAAQTFEETYPVVAGTNIGTLILNLLQIAFPSVATNFVTVTEVTPQLLVYLQGANPDPWKAAVSLAESVGMKLFFDGAGVATLRPEADNPDPVASYVDGEDNTAVSVGRTLSGGPGFNRVVVTSAGLKTAPVRGDVRDTDPASATYYGGNYGKRTHLVSDEKVGTVAQAEAMARTILTTGLGETAQMDVVAIPDPRRDAGHVVRVAVGKIGLDELARISKLTIPLGYDALMNITTERRT